MNKYKLWAKIELCQPKTPFLAASSPGIKTNLINCLLVLLIGIPFSYIKELQKQVGKKKKTTTNREDINHGIKENQHLKYYSAVLLFPPFHFESAASLQPTLCLFGHSSFIVALSSTAGKLLQHRNGWIKQWFSINNTWFPKFPYTHTRRETVLLGKVKKWLILYQWMNVEGKNRYRYFLLEATSAFGKGIWMGIIVKWKLYF